MGSRRFPSFFAPSPVTPFCLLFLDYFECGDIPTSSLLVGSRQGFVLLASRVVRGSSIQIHPVYALVLFIHVSCHLTLRFHSHKFHIPISYHLLGTQDRYRWVLGFWSKQDHHELAIWNQTQTSWTILRSLWKADDTTAPPIPLKQYRPKHPFSHQTTLIKLRCTRVKVGSTSTTRYKHTYLTIQTFITSYSYLHFTKTTPKSWR